MNIFLVTKLMDKYPFKTTEFELSESLRKRGHNVTLFMAKNIGENKPIKKDIIYLPTVDYRIISGLLFNIILFFYLPFIIQKKRADIIIASGAATWFPFALIVKLFGRPVLMDIRSLQIDKERWIPFDIFLYLSRYLLDGLTTITPELKKVLMQKYGIKGEKIGIWSSGVSLEKFTKLPITKNSISTIRDSKSFIVIYHGSYSPTRGIENLIKSIGCLKNPLRKKIKLLLVGINPNRTEDLLRLCNEIGVKEQTEFIPKVEYKEIPAYISLSDIGIIPLPPENEWWRVSSPLKTLEYLAMGKPIIATNIPFHQRIFDKGECGVLIETGSPKALADAITYLYQNRDKLDEMGKKGREIVEKYHTWDNKALELEKFLKTVLED